MFHGQNNGNDLLKPKYNSTLKIMKQIEDVKASNHTNFKIDETEIEKIHEKASTKLNFHNEPAFNGLVKLEPDEEEFLRYLQVKNVNQVKPQIGLHKSNTQNAPDLMEYYPNDLVKEYATIEIESIKQSKLATVKASKFIAEEPLRDYFKWN
jgi:hypothetical protein